MTGKNPLHVLLDISDASLAEAGTLLDKALMDGGWLGVAARVDVILPSGEQVAARQGVVLHASKLPRTVLVHAVEAATAARASLLILLAAGVSASNEIIPELRAALDADPLLGTAQPLFASPMNDRLWTPWGEEPEATLSRDALPELPAHIITAECVSACLLIRPSLLSDLVLTRELLLDGSLPGALAFVLLGARRRGFRNACCTRAVVVTEAPRERIYPTLSGKDLQTLCAADPSYERIRREDRQMPLARLAPLLGVAPCATWRQRRLLLDCRGLSPIHNGTSRNMLGQLEGFAVRGGDWDIDIVCGEHASAFHGLPERFPGLNHLTALPRPGYTAAFRLSQPWNWQVFSELHHRALVLGFNMLDTIAWDIGYVAPEGLGDVWRFAARHADMLTFISHFSRARFYQRFSRPAHLPEAVVHLSLSAAEHTRPDWQAPEARHHVLLFGNSYDHKGIGPALDLLRRAFPTVPIVVVGGTSPSSGQVRTLLSGEVTEEEIHGLISSAQAILFPSFYEGFGLPVVEGLSYGRPVLVRASPLWNEIAAHSRLPGNLVTFRDDSELVDRLGRILAGLPVPALEKAVALDANEPAPSWNSGVEQTLTALVQALDGAAERWLDRDLALGGRT